MSLNRSNTEPLLTGSSGTQDDGLSDEKQTSPKTEAIPDSKLDIY